MPAVRPPPHHRLAPATTPLGSSSSEDASVAKLCNTASSVTQRSNHALHKAQVPDHLRMRVLPSSAAQQQAALLSTAVMLCIQYRTSSDDANVAKLCTKTAGSIVSAQQSCFAYSTGHLMTLVLPGSAAQQAALLRAADTLCIQCRNYNIGEQKCCQALHQHSMADGSRDATKSTQ